MYGSEDICTCLMHTQGLVYVLPAGLHIGVGTLADVVNMSPTRWQRHEEALDIALSLPEQRR